MTVFLEIKEKMKRIYAEYAYTIIIVLKFLLAISVFLSINNKIGFYETLCNIYLIVILALLCSLFSVKSVAVFAGMLILGHCYALGLEVMGITAVLFILLFFFFLRFDEKDGLGFLLTPLALAFGIPVFIPICYGLKRKPASAVSIVSGIIVYYYVCMLSEKAVLLQNVDQEDVFNGIVMNLRVLMDGLLKNRLMFLTAAALTLVLCIVYLLRRLPIDHIWHIAIGTGAVAYLLIMISGGLFWDVNVSIASIVLGTLFSGLMALVMEFFVLNVDYSRTERMEFEDDDYYYYVKAVPKITISQSFREIKTISAETKVPEISEEKVGTSAKNVTKTDYISKKVLEYFEVVKKRTKRIYSKIAEWIKNIRT